MGFDLQATIVTTDGILQPNAMWRVTALTRPVRDLSEHLFLATQGGGRVDAVMAGADDTFVNLWKNGNTFVELYAGFLAAFVSKLEGNWNG